MESPQIQLEYATPEPQRGHGLAVASLVCGIAGFLVPLIGGLIGLAFGVLAMNRTTDSQRRDKKYASAGIILSGLSILVALLVIPTILPPFFNRGCALPNRVSCASNMRQIGLALLMYSNENHGAYPPTLNVLLTTEDILPDVFVCPSTNDTVAPGSTEAAQAANLSGNHLSYIYVGKGMTTTAPANAVLLYEKPGNHGNDGCNVLFGDGHVGWIAQNAAKQLIADIQAGRNPPPKRSN